MANVFILFLFCCNFFRDPERIPPAEASSGDVALSPAEVMNTVFPAVTNIIGGVLYAWANGIKSPADGK